MNAEQSLNKAWLERHIADCIEFADPHSGLSDSPHSLTCMTLNGDSMSMFATARAKRASLRDMVLLACSTNKRWLMDNRYAVFPQVLQHWTTVQELRNLPEDKITVFGVNTYPFLDDDTQAKETAINQTTNFRDTHAFHGGLYYIGKDIPHQDEADLDQILLDINCVSYPVSYARYPYPVKVLRHLTYDPPLEPWWTRHKPYVDLQVYTTNASILASHLKILSDRPNNLPVLIIDSDFLPATDACWPFQRVSVFEEQYVNLFQTVNPLNGLMYGHGGPKLLKRLDNEPEVRSGQENNHSQQLAHVDMTSLFAASKGMKIHSVVGVHNYCWSEFSTWRTAFREAFKLTLLLRGDGLAPHHRDQARHRLHTWMGLSNGGDRLSYSDYISQRGLVAKRLTRQEFDLHQELSVQGATVGSAFASLEKKSHLDINNYEDLQQLFTDSRTERKL
jgi:hypothetical protein